MYVPSYTRSCMEYIVGCNSNAVKLKLCIHIFIE